MIARRLPLALGTVVITLFFAAIHATRLAPTPYPVFGTQRLVWTIAFVGMVLVASYASGLPELPTSRLYALGAALGAVTVGLVGVSLAQLLLGAPLLPRAVLGGVTLTFLPWAVLCWNAESDRSRRSSTNALYVGNPQEFAELQADLASETIPIELLGRVEPDNDLTEMVETNDVGMLILDIASLADSTVVTEVSELHKAGVRVRTVSLFAEEFLGKIPIADLERMSLLFDIGELHRVRYVRWKRLIDVGFGVAALVGLAPISLFVLVGNRLGNPGPLLYRQERVGKDGRTFEILKFRSMRPDDAAGSNWTTEDDPRITPFGSLLRRSHLDELPQAWNVLRGDLSIVGPRPEQPHYVTSLSEKIPFYDVRHLVRPGLTGWAQVNYPYGADEVDAREKLQYDLYYLRRQAPRLDIQILVRTIRTVIGRTGR
ncbi:MAG: exopolysaccharide biosynthesis polyprenyl glycosylphosphotransferase [Acidimicrobiales bacterium]|nr:exopolysaccharide biosynthesis polyprenyl glycosylphosphotransferase [Acidimicrobiales bacterium]